MQYLDIGIFCLIIGWLAIIERRLSKLEAKIDFLIKNHEFGR